MNIRPLVYALLWAIAVYPALLTAPARAQSAAGQSGISGTVHDATGAVVPGAKVVISTAAQGEVRTITTNSAGVFSAPALLPGSGYKVTVTVPGFALRDFLLNINCPLDIVISVRSPDPALAAGINVVRGQITNESVAAAHELTAVPLETI